MVIGRRGLIMIKLRVLYQLNEFGPLWHGGVNEKEKSFVAFHHRSSAHGNALRLLC
jgi:hypothetical protein